MSGEKEGIGVCGTEHACSIADVQQDVGYALAGNIARIRYEDLPGDVVDVTKKTILDILGTIFGGSGAGAGIKEIVEVVKDGGGREESSVLGYGIKTNAWMAAFANGAMAHALDYDNVHDDAFTHPSTSTVPAALAVAERVGKVNGKDFITAIALGDDLHCRLGYALCRAGDFSTQGPGCRHWHWVGLLLRQYLQSCLALTRNG